MQSPEPWLLFQISDMWRGLRSNKMKMNLPLNIQNRHWVNFVFGMTISFNISAQKNTVTTEPHCRFSKMNVQTLARTSNISSQRFWFLSYIDLISHLRRSHTQISIDHYRRQISYSSAYFHIQPILPAKPWFTNFQHLSRKSIVAMCRLRFNDHWASS